MNRKVTMKIDTIREWASNDYSNFWDVADIGVAAPIRKIQFLPAENLWEYSLHYDNEALIDTLFVGYTKKLTNELLRYSALNADRVAFYQEHIPRRNEVLIKAASLIRKCDLPESLEHLQDQFKRLHTPLKMPGLNVNELCYYLKENEVFPLVLDPVTGQQCSLAVLGGAYTLINLDFENGFNAVRPEQGRTQSHA